MPRGPAAAHRRQPFCVHGRPLRIREGSARDRERSRVRGERLQTKFRGAGRFAQERGRGPPGAVLIASNGSPLLQ